MFVIGNLRKPKYLRKFHQFDIEFKNDCREGKLLNYVLTEQRYFDLFSIPANDDHPSHDVSQGQMLVKEIYEALRASPQWNQILFIITYDERGGFYDHVSTPVTGVPSPDHLVGPPSYYFNFDRLGVRVPAMFISPLIDRGTVTLPEPVKMRDREAKENEKLSDFQQELIQMAATLDGDHRKDVYPHKLVEKMTDAGAMYAENAFHKFHHECDKARARGADDSEIVVVAPTKTPT